MNQIAGKCQENETIYITQNGNITFNELKEQCRQARIAPVHQLEDLLLGKIGPLPIFLTGVTNILITIVLTRRHMISPTNLILLGMAMADMSTVLFPLPVIIAKNFPDFYLYPTLTKVYIDLFLNTFLPTVFHTVSIWLTVALAVQRFIYVTFPTQASTICTVKGSVKVLVAINLLALLSHMGIVFGVKFYRYVRLCPDSSFTYFLARCNLVGDQYNICYNWFRVIMLHVTPCLSLSVFTILLMMAIRKTEKKRRELLTCKKTQSDKSAPSTESSSSRRVKEANKTSKMLLVVLLMFLVVEIPTGIVILLYTSSFTFGLNFNIPWSTVTTICNFCIIVSYPVNFFVYCTMSTQFRDTFNSLFGLKEADYVSSCCYGNRNAQQGPSTISTTNASKTQVPRSRTGPPEYKLVTNGSSMLGQNNRKGSNPECQAESVPQEIQVMMETTA